MNFKKINVWVVLLLVAVMVMGQGCASLTPKTITTVTDAGGKVTQTVADASVAKEQAVHKTLQNESTRYYKALGNTGAKMGIKAFQEIILADGSKAFLPLMESSFIEAPQRNTHLPTAPSEHPVWGVAKDVAKYGFMAYGVHEVSGLVSSLVSGASSGIEVNGDNNTFQGNQNEAGENQEIRSDYVSCASGECGEEAEPEQYIDENGNCRVSPDCSCDSYNAGECS